MSTEQPARRERKKERTRQALLDTALSLMAERGIHGTRVEDITELCDLGKGAFYNYFDSKDGLVAALVAQGVELLHGRYVAAPRAPVTRTQRIADVIAAHERFFDEHPAYVVLFHQARGVAIVHSDEHAPLVAAFTLYLRRTGEAIVLAEDRGRIDDAALLELAAVVLGSIAGYRTFRLAASLAVGSPVVDVLTRGAPDALTARLRPPPD